MGKEIIFCQWCKNEIKKGEKVACMNTYNEFPKVSDERYFHFDCFLDWRDNKIKEAGINAFKKSMPITMNMVKPMVKEITDKVIKNINNEEETEENKVYDVGLSK